MSHIGWGGEQTTIYKSVESPKENVNEMLCKSDTNSSLRANFIEFLDNKELVSPIICMNHSNGMFLNILVRSHIETKHSL